MREIEFRLWCKNKNEWEQDAWFVAPDGVVYDMKRFFPYKPETHILMQFTGLLDKNGKKIFESDILSVYYPYYEKWSDDGAEVIFSNDYVGGWVISNGKTNLNLGTRQEHLKVIGNIHQNPELLKE